MIKNILLAVCFFFVLSGISLNNVAAESPISFPMIIAMNNAVPTADKVKPASTLLAFRQYVSFEHHTPRLFISAVDSTSGVTTVCALEAYQNSSKTSTCAGIQLQVAANTFQNFSQPLPVSCVAEVNNYFYSFLLQGINRRTGEAMTWLIAPYDQGVLWRLSRGIVHDFKTAIEEGRPLPTNTLITRASCKRGWARSNGRFFLAVTESTTSGSTETLVLYDQVGQNRIPSWKQSLNIPTKFQKPNTVYARDFFSAGTFANPAGYLYNPDLDYTAYFAFLLLGDLYSFNFTTAGSEILAHIQNPCGISDLYAPSLRMLGNESYLVLFANAPHFTVCVMQQQLGGSNGGKITEVGHFSLPVELVLPNGEASVTIAHGKYLFVSGRKVGASNSSNTLFCFDIISGGKLLFSSERLASEQFNLPTRSFKNIYEKDELEFVAFSASHYTNVVNAANGAVAARCPYSCSSSFAVRNWPELHKLSPWDYPPPSATKANRIVCVSSTNKQEILAFDVNETSCNLRWKEMAPKPVAEIQIRERAERMTTMEESRALLPPFLALVLEDGTSLTLSFRAHDESDPWTHPPTAPPYTPPPPPPTKFPPLPPDEWPQPKNKVFLDAESNSCFVGYPGLYPGLMSVQGLSSVVAGFSKKGPAIGAFGSGDDWLDQKSSLCFWTAPIDGTTRNAPSAIWTTSDFTITADSPPIVFLQGPEHVGFATQLTTGSRKLIIVFSNSSTVSGGGSLEIERFGATAEVGGDGKGLLAYATGVVGDAQKKTESVVVVVQRGDGLKTVEKFKFDFAAPAGSINSESNIGMISINNDVAAFSHLNSLFIYDLENEGKVLLSDSAPCGYKASKYGKFFNPMAFLTTDDFIVTIIDTTQTHGKKTYGICVYSTSSEPTARVEKRFGVLLTNTTFVLQATFINDGGEQGKDGVILLDVYNDQGAGQLLAFSTRSGAKLFSLPRINSYGVFTLPYPLNSNPPNTARHEEDKEAPPVLSSLRSSSSAVSASLNSTGARTFVTNVEANEAEEKAGFKMVFALVEAGSGRILSRCARSCLFFSVVKDSSGREIVVCSITHFTSVIRGLYFSRGVGSQVTCDILWETYMPTVSPVIGMSSHSASYAKPFGAPHLYWTASMADGSVFSASPDAV